MSESDPGEARAFAAGQTDARLANHDQHFADINGSIGRLIGEIHGLRLDVQRLGDEAKANAATVITTAAALKDAEAARRDKSETSWSPFQRALAVTAVLVALAGLLVATGKL